MGILTFMGCQNAPKMLGFILFEGFALVVLRRAFGYRRGVWSGYIYSASDIYFSAITPSATGGQPASAYFMIKDGVPGMVVTVTLVANLFMYTLSIIAIGFVCFFFIKTKKSQKRLFLELVAGLGLTTATKRRADFAFSPWLGLPRL